MIVSESLLKRQIAQVKHLGHCGLTFACSCHNPFWVLIIAILTREYVIIPAPANRHCNAARGIAELAGWGAHLQNKSPKGEQSAGIKASTLVHCTACGCRIGMCRCTLMRVVEVKTRYSEGAAFLTYSFPFYCTQLYFLPAPVPD